MEQTHNRISEVLDELLADGRIYTTRQELSSRLAVSADALKVTLNRMVRKGRMARIHKGFYVIVPSEYRHQHILPPALFIDNLMKFIRRPYYVALLSAAELHGAGHQQPQEFQVMIQKPSLRAITVKAMRIRFYAKSQLSDRGIISKKTDTGFIRVAGPELTALDLLAYDKQVGGINRAVTVLSELAEFIDPKLLADQASMFPVVHVQRLGYLLEHVLDQVPIANLLFETLRDRAYYRIYLKPSLPRGEDRVANRWKVIDNVHPEVDL
ncbi:type IV toxin-antitoxin system AbiEi family antitoxin [bacterium]|nr:type IV toxin-antitoxin system AbiEi family antitoxin [candidate division CSSED10-310 bacterium]